MRLRLRHAYTLIVAFWLGMQPVLQAQDVGGFWDEINQRMAANEVLRVSGNLQAGLRWNSIQGINARVAPFQANLNAGLLVDVLGIKGPFSAAFSNRNSTYQLPAYAFYGFSPSYKWIKLHFGDRSLNFSPYTLSGHNFKGFGLELTPGKFYVGLMRGRLRRERLIDAGAIQNLDPIYRRVGTSLKLGYENGGDQLGVVLFHAQDDENSLDLPDSNRVLAQENLVLEFQAKKQLGQLFQLEMAIAHSALSRDKEAPLIQDAGSGFNGTIFGLFDPRSSTSYNQAYNLGLVFSPEFAQFNFKYERLGAGFRSLGVLAFLNDTEQLSLGTSTSLFKNKVNLSANVGLQRNGISQRTLTGGRRLIGSLNLGIAVSERVSTNFSVSNFNYTLRQRVATVPFVVVDSIVIVQSNFSAQAATTILLDETGQSALSLTGAYQSATAINGDEVEETAPNRFYTLMAAYSLSSQNTGWNATLSSMLNFTEFAGIGTRIFSPALSLQKALLDNQLKIDLGLSYSAVSSDSQSASAVLESRLGTDWKMTDSQALRFQLVYVNNQSQSSSSSFADFQDLNLSLNYRLSF